MARKIDYSNLSEDDKAWLRSWNRPVPEDATEPVAEPEGSGAPVPTPEDSNSQENGQEGQGDDSGGSEEDADYNEWTVEELQEELVARNLPKSGKKEDLVARLESDDAKS